MAPPQPFEYGHRSNASQSWGGDNADALQVVKSVWEQASPIDIKQSLLPAILPSNSLKDLVDDFPSQLPSMNDLRSDDGHVSDGPESSIDPVLATTIGSSAPSQTEPDLSATLSAVTSPPSTNRLPPPFVPNTAPLPGIKAHQQPWSQHYQSQNQFGSNAGQQRNHASYGSNSFYNQPNGMGNPGIWSHPNQYGGVRGNAPTSYGPTSPTYPSPPMFQQMPLYQPAQPPQRVPSSQGPPRQAYFPNAYDYSMMNPQAPAYQSYPPMAYPNQPQGQPQQGGQRKGRW
jgi:hypothetical protein